MRVKRVRGNERFQEFLQPVVETETHCPSFSCASQHIHAYIHSLMNTHVRMYAHTYVPARTKQAAQRNSTAYRI